MDLGFEIARTDDAPRAAVDREDHEDVKAHFQERLVLVAQRAPTTAVEKLTGELGKLRALSEADAPVAGTSQSLVGDLPASERREVEMLHGEIVDWANLMWEGYCDPERVTRRTAHLRARPLPVGDDLRVQATNLRAEAKTSLEAMFARMLGGAERAKRLGLLMRIDQIAEGGPKESGWLFSAYDDKITDEDLSPAVSRAPGAKKSETHEVNKALFVSRLLREKCGVKVSENTIESDWKDVRIMRRKRRGPA